MSPDTWQQMVDSDVSLSAINLITMVRSAYAIITALIGNIPLAAGPIRRFCRVLWTLVVSSISRARRRSWVQ